MKYAFGILIFLMTLNSQGQNLVKGGSDVGGGMGVVCRDTAKNITSVELLDLWEARVVYGRTIKSLPDSLESKIAIAVDQLKYATYSPRSLVTGVDSRGNEFSYHGAEAIKWMLQRRADQFLAPNLPNIRRIRGARLERTKDSYESVKPRECKVEQLVRYIDNANGGYVLVDQDLVDKMDMTNQAALYLHEAFYANLRPWEKSSLRVRRVIGAIFSDFQFYDFDKALPFDFYECKGGVSRGQQAYENLTEVLVYAQPYESGKLLASAQVVRLAGRPNIGYASIRGGRLIDPTDELFPAEYVWQHWENLNDTFGYDFNYRLVVYKENGENKVKIQLLSAPDQKAPSKEYVLKCNLVNKNSPLTSPK